MRRLWWFALPVAAVAVVFFLLLRTANQSDSNHGKTEVREREWGEETNGCRLSIQLKDPPAEEQTPVTISVIIKNAGEKTVSFEATYPNKTFKLAVRDEKGNSVPLTEYGEYVQKLQAIYSVIVQSLAPGERAEYIVEAGKLYDITLPGTYTITARLHVAELDDQTSGTVTVRIPTPEEWEKTAIKSNTITVKVS